jgi:hypothetical protein
MIKSNEILKNSKKKQRLQDPRILLGRLLSGDWIWVEERGASRGLYRKVKSNPSCCCWIFRREEYSANGLGPALCPGLLEYYRLDENGSIFFAFRNFLVSYLYIYHFRLIQDPAGGAVQPASLKLDQSLLNITNWLSYRLINEKNLFMINNNNNNNNKKHYDSSGHLTSSFNHVSIYFF